MHPIDTKILAFLAVLILLASCAQIKMPQGGIKDEIAPQLSEAGSTPNKQTNFAERKIEFEFDEWIKLSNPIKEVFVSPPLAYPPQISVRGKVVTFEFSEKEVLKENTTYQINFGKAIQDITEGNVVENLVFLFSTGDEIDQLFLKGKILDALTGSAVKDVVVMLYDNLSDTCFTTVKPLYLTRTDDEGQFSLENLRADTFQIFALDDQNVSYTYDVETERVAFLDSMVMLQDTFMTELTLQMFDEADNPKLIEARQRVQGLVNVVYQNRPDSLVVTLLDNDTTQVWQEYVGDTLKIWHNNENADSLLFTITNETEVDTIKAKKTKKKFDKYRQLLLTNNLELLPSDSIVLEFTLPVAVVDTSRVTLQDTAFVTRISEVKAEGRYVYLRGPMKVDNEYDLILDSMAVTSWYGPVYKDSTSIKIKTLDPETFGNILLTANKADSLTYVVQLIEKEEPIETMILRDQTAFAFSDLPSGQYSLKLIQDLNEDGQWTAGSIADKKLPEKTKELNLEVLKAGWDLEATLDIETLFYGTDSK